MRFNGLDPRTVSPKCFVSHEVIGAIPQREVRTVQTGSGSLVAGVDLMKREIHLFLNFAGASHENANLMASKIASFFCTDTPGEYEPTHMPGRAFSAILREAGDMEWRWGFGTVEYTFIAPRPFSHSLAETVVDLTGHVIRIEPRGDVPARPVLTHTMSEAASSLIYSIGGNDFFKLRDPSGNAIQAGTTIAVDFEQRRVRVNGTTDMTYVDYTASDWHPQIVGGTRIYCSDAGMTEARWRDEWM